MPSEGDSTKQNYCHFSLDLLHQLFLVPALLILLTCIPESIKLCWGSLLVPKVAICLFCSIAWMNQFLYYYSTLSALNILLIHYHLSHEYTMFSIEFSTCTFVSARIITSFPSSSFLYE